MQKEWKNIEDFPSYEVSNYGEIRNKKTNRILKAWSTERGYPRVDLCKDGNKKPYRIHRLVAKHFVPNPQNKTYVNHKDGNKKNNKANNLEWCTAKENTAHAIKNGLLKPINFYQKGENHPMKPINFYQKGENHPNAKLSNKDVVAIKKAIKSGIDSSEIYKNFDITKSQLCDIKHGRKWNHIQI